MSTACGRPQGVERVRPMWAHVDRGEGVKNLIFLWTSYMDGPLCPPILPRSYSISLLFFKFHHIFRCSYVLILNFLLPTKMLHFLPPKLTKSFVSPLNDKFSP